MSLLGNPRSIPPWQQLVTGRWAISLRAWLFIALLMQWPSYARNSVPANLSPQWAVGIGILRVLAAGLVLLVADRTYLRNRAEVPAHLWVVVATWVTAGMAAMAVQSAALLYLEADGVTALRWIVSSVTFAMRSALCAYYFGLRDHWKHSIIDLESSAVRLLELRAISRASLADIRTRARIIVVDQVLPKLHRLQRDLAMDGDSLSRDRLVPFSRIDASYAQGIVRKASHEVSDLTPNNPEESLSQRQKNSEAIWRSGSRPLMLSIRWSALVLLVTLVPTAFTAPPDDPALPILIVVGLLLALIALGAWMQSKLVGHGHLLMTAWSLGWMAGAAVATVSVATVTAALPSRLSTPVPTLTLTAIIFLLILLASSIDRHLSGVRSQVQELAAMTAQIAAINEALLADIAAEKRRVALLLHGPVQGRLAAVALLLRLEASSDSEESRAQVHERCLVILDHIVADLTQVLDGSFDYGQCLQDRLDQLTQQWSGLVTVSVIIHPGVEHAVANEPELRLWIFDIIEEGINNAVTHGDASHVDVTIHAGEGLAETCVIDNGSGCGEAPTPGLGLATIGRAPAQWSLSSTALGGSELRVRLPYAPTGLDPE
jgi:signal transduction histidine kinase